MYPITLDVTRVRIALIGTKEVIASRLQQLQDAGATQITLFELPPSEEELKGVDIVLVNGFDGAISKQIYDTAKKIGKLVNVEDKKEFCDFHYPSMVRRGDLLLTASTGGKSPALARSIRKTLESLFGDEWEERLNVIGEQREKWREEGLSFNEVMQRSDALIEEQGWLKQIPSGKTKK